MVTRAIDDRISLATLRRSVAFLLIFLGASFGVLADGLGDSADPKRRHAVRRCAAECLPTCSAPVTVNCQPGPRADKGPSSSSEPAKTVPSTYDSSWVQIVTHIIDILPALAGLLLATLLIVRLVPADVVIRLLPNLKKVKAGQFEVEFNLERARAVEQNFKDSFGTFKTAAQMEYDRQTTIHQLHEVFMPDAVDAVRQHLEYLPPKYRATVHVPDVVFRRFLYQLLDYYPGGEGRGRRFSERYGIIGRCWRMRKSTADKNAVVSTDRPVLAVNEEENRILTLIRDWGMTRQEAEQARRNRRSVLCIILKVPKHDREIPIGLLYMDAEEENAFWRKDPRDADDLPRELEQLSSIKALALAVNDVMIEMRKGAASLEVV